MTFLFVNSDLDTQTGQLADYSVLFDVLLNWTGVLFERTLEMDTRLSKCKCAYVLLRNGLTSFN